MKVPFESKSQICFICFSLIVHAGRNEVISGIKFESLPSFEPSFSQFTQYEQEDLAQGMRKEPDFLSQFRYAKLNETISNTMLLMMHLLILFATLNEISLYITICFKSSKTFEIHLHTIAQMKLVTLKNQHTLIRLKFLVVDTILYSTQ